MRARNIKPAFFKNEELAGCSMAARLLAIGLWTLADREGKMEYRPLRIKAEVFPYDNVEIVALLDELARSKHIIVYSLGASQYIQIPNFLKHQRPHKNELKSEIPDFTMGEINNPAKVESTCDQGTKHFALNPSSLNPECGMRNDESNNPLPPKGGGAKKSYSPEFEIFWKAYPPNGAPKEKASESYAKAIAKGASHEAIIGAIAEYRSYCQRSDTRIAHATTWLNQCRWTVDYASLEREPRSITGGRVYSGDAATNAHAAAQEIIRKRREAYAARELGGAPDTGNGTGGKFPD